MIWFTLNLEIVNNLYWALIQCWLHFWTVLLFFSNTHHTHCLYSKSKVIVVQQVGFEEEMKQIIRLIPVKRQSMLFSATQTRNVEDLARISLQQAPLYVGVDDEKEKSTVEGLEQVCVVHPGYIT